MNFKEELCNLSAETKSTKDAELLRVRKELWEVIKSTLKTFTQKTDEKGCFIFFQNISNETIEQFKQFATEDGVDFLTSMLPLTGCTHTPYKQIGIITWNSSEYFQKASSNASKYSIVVSRNNNKVRVKIFSRIS